MDIKQIKEKLSAKIKNLEEKNERRFYIDIAPKDIVEVAKILFEDLGFRFIIATGIDRRDGFEVIYHFSDDRDKKVVNVRALIEDKKNPEIDSITSVVKGANWIECEIWEMLGIKFRGHPNLKHLLLVDDWPEGDYPLRQGMGGRRKQQ